MKYLLKSLYYSIHRNDRDRLILESLTRSPKTALMLSQELGFEVGIGTLRLLETDRLLTSWMDGSRLPARNFQRRRFYSAILKRDETGLD